MLLDDKCKLWTGIVLVTFLMNVTKHMTGSNSRGDGFISTYGTRR